MTIKRQIKIPQKLISDKIEKVVFFGSADIEQDHPVCQEVFKAAREMAQQGKVVVSGGGPGVMEAATKGAESVEGETVAITFEPKDMPEFEGRASDNVVDIELQTANYIERMFGLIYYADLIVCFKGGTGTLSEWSTAWLLAHLYYGKHKPMILYGEFWHEVIAAVTKHFFIGEKETQVYRIVTNQEELVQAVKELEQELEERG
ncbi:MAG: LOG family protein [Patescibacteria group bacterium]|nr:LOG family protein [Patescibacteria group bacterium]